MEMQFQFLQTQHYRLDQIFETKLFEICTIIYIFTKSYIIVKMWYQNLKFDKTYWPKGYLVLVIPGVVSIDQVHYQNPQLYSTGIMVWIPWKWKLRRLKIEKWGLVIHIIISFGFWYDACHQNTDLRAG